ncbi:class F sortase [Actinoalloteichus spitiensis]|uniref:class F sortase n=1 Tax=Actinoalloteichus spitiensis TaxID=252394 RepID=UPI000378D4E1|nr:class F sortase [Actinoalloteichus spitiensis]
MYSQQGYPSDSSDSQRPRRGARKWIGLVSAGVAAALLGVLVAVLIASDDDAPEVVAAPTSSERPAAEPSAVPPPAVPDQPSAPVTDAPQPPGTVRLADGGVATLVRTEVIDGVLPIPEDLGEAAWWGAGLGAASGASVMSGHVNWRGQDGPFDQLHRAQVGQRVEVTDVDGGTWVYRTVEVFTLHKDELPARAEDLFGQQGPHRLVLVTCGGEFVGGQDGYEDNRVVIAELESSPADA